MLDLDADQVALDDGQVAVPAGEVGTVAVDLGVDVPPAGDAYGAVAGGAGQDQLFVGLGVGDVGALDAFSELLGRSELARPDDRVAVVDVLGRQPHHQVHVHPGQCRGERGGRVSGVQHHDRDRHVAACLVGLFQPPYQRADLVGGDGS